MSLRGYEARMARPRCADRLPSHISKTVKSTLCGGGAEGMIRSMAPFLHTRHKADQEGR